MPQRAMTASTSKSTADLFVWHRRFAHLNEASIKQLANYTSSSKMKQKSQDSHIKSLGRILQPPDFIYMLMLEVVVILMPHSADFATLFFLSVKQRVMYGRDFSKKKLIGSHCCISRAGGIRTVSCILTLGNLTLRQLLATFLKLVSFGSHLCQTPNSRTFLSKDL